MAQQGPREVRLYPNRRLYDTVTARYITFDDVFELARDGIAFVIRNSDSGRDITRRVLMDAVIAREMRMTAAEKSVFTSGLIGELIRQAAGEQPALAGRFLEHSLAHLANGGRTRK